MRHNATGHKRFAHEGRSIPYSHPLEASLRILDHASNIQPLSRSRRPRLAPLLAVLLLILCSACGTFVAHSVPAGAYDEIVDLRCYARYYFVYIEECHITSVDGLRPGLGKLLNLGAELSPGRHSVGFVTDTTISFLGVRHDYCTFEHDFRAGHRYRMVANSLEYDQKGGVNNPAVNNASVELEQSGPDGAASTQRIALFCSVDKP
jgi:hypothetical protein